jgi:hypothetical protein
MEDAAGVAPTLEDGWLAWEVQGKPVSVRLSPDVAGRLRMAVWEGFKALPRRGLETGGLLIGTTREMGNQIVVEVDDFEPMETEHASGPSYVLSDADLRLLEARIAAREDPESPSIVGFYRSHTRSNFAITAEDASLFSRFFPAASHVFLLIKSNDDGPPTGGFIIREGGKVLSDSPYAQFPLPLTTVMATARETRVPALHTSQAPPRVAPIVPPPAPLRTGWMVRRPVWLATAAAVALCVALSVGIRKRSPGSIPAKPGLPLALNVTTAGNSLRLSWDRQSSGHAGNSVLWIKDGQEEQRFELDSKQLSEGSVTYWPRNNDVNFRLELLSPGANVTESVRAIGGPSRALVVIPTPAAIAVESPPVPAVQAPAVAAVKTSPALVRSRKTPRRHKIGATSRQHSRAFVLPQRPPDPVAAASLPDPPTIRPVVAPPPEHSEEFLKAIVPANRLAGADSSVRVSVEPVSGSRRSIPLIGKRYPRTDYAPPAPLRNPGPPSSQHRNVTRAVNINVKVYVNPSGKVDYSEVLSKVAESDRDLAAFAMFAARWEFVPARDADGTVPGEVILHYQFGPGGRATGNQDLATR